MAEVLEEHGTDRWNFSHLPEVVVFAESRDDVVAVMRFANEHSIPVTTRGAGVGYVGGCVPVKGGIALSVARMNAIVELAPEDGVVVTQPGVILLLGNCFWREVLEAALGPERMGEKGGCGGKRGGVGGLV